MLETDWTKKELLILPFDHRGTFLKGMFGVKDRDANEKEAKKIAEYKMVIYNALKKVIAEKDLEKESVGVLVDEQFGSEVAKKAKRDGIKFAISCERSGQDEFDFEYGAGYKEHIKKFNPTFAKVLVRMNPAWDEELNKRQLGRLKELGDYLKGTNTGYLFELLVPPTDEQLNQFNGDKTKYDSVLRPKLMLECIKKIHEAGINPNIWKLEGIDNLNDSNAVAKLVQSGGRKAGIIVLGRGATKEKVEEWLRVGAKTSGVIGFAVGRTVFWDALTDLHNGKIDRETALNTIADNYYNFVDLWKEERV